jgi:hypothetical protein
VRTLAAVEAMAPGIALCWQHSTKVNQRCEPAAASWSLLCVFHKVHNSTHTLHYITLNCITSHVSCIMLHCLHHAADAPSHWRMRAQAAAAARQELDPDAAAAAAVPGLAFEGLRVIFYGSSEAPSFDTLSRVLNAGGVQLLKRGPPYSAVLPAVVDAAGSGGGRKKKKGAAAAVSEAAAAAAAGFANLAVIGADKADDADDK